MELELKTYIKAGYPILACRTQEPIRFTVAASEQVNGRNLIQWDAARGYQQIGSKKGWIEAEPYAIPDAAATIPGSVWLLRNFHFWLKEPQVIQRLQNNIPLYKDQQITLIIISPDFELPPELAREIVLLDFPMPGREELETVLDALAKAQELTIEDKQPILDALQGLTWEEAESALAYGLVKDKELKPATLAGLKSQMVEKSAGLQFSKFRETFKTLAACQNMKEWSLNRFQRRRPGLPFRGILILGAPGCGKSHFSKALGNEVNWPVVTLDLGRVFGGLVGQSEQQMENALRTIDALAPAIVIIEEIEKALAGVGGGGTTDGGTTQRVGAKFLTWLQDHESEIFVCATCNDFKSLAAASGGAYVRSGRWDATFFVDLPTRKERREILAMYLKQFCEKELEDFAKLPDLEGYSGAEIRQVAIEAAYNGGNLEAAVDFVIPLSKTNKDQIDELRKWSQGRTIPATIPEPTTTGAGPDPKLYEFSRTVEWLKGD